MRRAGALSVVAGLTNTRRGRGSAGGGGPQVRHIRNLTGTNLNWADGSPGSLLHDNSPGDNTTWYGQTGGSGQSITVAALYDLGSAQVVTRVRRRRGTANGNSYGGSHIEASNDGVNWVNAWTGGVLPGETLGGTFTWEAEEDWATNITTTPYRYWRTVVVDNGGEGTGETRIGDFRLYVGGNLVL